jgi:diguanylate cyclase (GGDEF)-like protein
LLRGIPQNAFAWRGRKGNEFTELPFNTSNVEMAILAEHIVHRNHSLEVECNGAIANVGCSMGITRYPCDASSLQGLLELADHAMYEAKHSGKNNWVLHHAAK